MRRRKKIAAEFNLIGINRIDWADSLKNDRVGRRTAVAVVGLTGVRAKIAEGNTTDQERIVAELFVAFRRERKHSLTAPPCHRRPRPADSVTVDNNRTAQNHNSQ